MASLDFVVENTQPTKENDTESGKWYALFSVFV